MGKIIPYFYTDVIARMVPGTVLIALLSITTLPMPKPWVAIVKSLGSAQAVIVPILFAGLTYVLGTVLDALLSHLLEYFYIRIFDCKLRKYSPLYQESNDINRGVIRTAKDLSRAAFGHLITSTSDNEKQAIPHLLRFHSEGKMCFTSMIILAAFLVLAIANKCIPFQLIRDVDNAYLWLIIIILTILSLSYTTYDRLWNRVVFIVKTIERSASEDGFEATKKLRDDLFTFRNSKKSNN